MSLRSWWKRLWQPGPVEPEYVYGPTFCGEVTCIAGTNVTEVTYFAITPTGNRVPIMTSDGCPLHQYLQPGHVHVTPVDLFPFVEVVPIAKVDDPSEPASVECSGRVAVDQVWLEEQDLDTDD